MKKILIVILVCCGTFSCKDIQTKKVSADDLKSKNLKEVNWGELSQYPSFAPCENSSAKQERLNCFQKKMADHVYQSLSNKDIVLLDSIHEEIWVKMVIARNGDTGVDSIVISDSLQSQAPQLKQWITEAVVSLPKLNPGIKRGVPVRTKFKLPILIQSD